MQFKSDKRRIETELESTAYREESLRQKLKDLKDKEVGEGKGKSKPTDKYGISFGTDATREAEGREISS